MPAPFLHGIETVEYLNGPVQVRTVASAVIGLVGTAPIHLVDAADRTINQPVLVTSDRDAARLFGPETSGYTIPGALKRIFQQGSGPVIVVNVFDPATHVTETTPDPTKVGPSDVIGGTTAGGQRTGMQAFRDCRTAFGFGPRQLIAPGFSSATGMTVALDLLAGQLRAIAWVDAAPGLTVAQALADRGVGQPLNTSSKRIGLLYPMVKALDAAGATVVEPLSPFVAGAQAQKDTDRGYWWSVSNTDLKAVIGLERPILATLNDPACEANQLNAAGFLTVYNDYGTGFRIWGNRSAAFPVSSAPDTFIAVRRTADVIEDSIEAASLRYVDHPITKALVDQIVGDVDAFLRTLQGKGAVLEGSRAFYDPSRNPASELAAGHLVVSYRFLPPSPLERLTFEGWLDINLYSGLKV